MAILYRRTAIRSPTSTLSSTVINDGILPTTTVRCTSIEQEKRSFFQQCCCLLNTSSRKVPGTIQTVRHVPSNISTLRRIYQTLWLATLVYLFFGIPIVIRILYCLKRWHRLKITVIVQMIAVGLFQDIAILFQVTACICILKHTLHSTSDYYSTTKSSYYAGNAGFNSHYPYDNVHPSIVYRPVVVDEIENGQLHQHLTLLTTNTSTPDTLPSSRIYRLWTWIRSIICTVFIAVIVFIATATNVIDFCLQVTMHPRLNRAFVEIFVNYAAQFAGSLMDEEILTPIVLCAWFSYGILVSLLTYGFVTSRIPLDLRLTWWFCKDCLHTNENPAYIKANRKNSFLPPTIATKPTPSGSNLEDIAECHESAPLTPSTEELGGNNTKKSILSKKICRNYTLNCWRRKDSNQVSRTTSGQPKAPLLHVHARYFTIRWVVLLARSIALTTVTTLGALSLSLLVDGTDNIEVKNISNALFSLETEGFFQPQTKLQFENVNCSHASLQLLSTLATSELYEKLDENDHDCTLLWRKTIGFTGPKWYDLNIPMEKDDSELKELSKALNANETTGSNINNEDPQLNVDESSSHNSLSKPNIIVINMESWRSLDVGVLGGSKKKASTGKSATPEFDALTQTGILYRNHYTQCVQTTRTLLTTLFGMLPSCTETTALKRYGPKSLHVTGLTHFLKSRGYFNLFWSAVDLTWEYWDQFLLNTGFDTLVDDKMIRKMLHQQEGGYEDRDDDHFSWGMHDHLSFDMLFHAIEQAQVRADLLESAELAANNSSSSLQNENDTELMSNSTITSVDTEANTNSTTNVRGSSTTSASSPPSTSSAPLYGWEALTAPYFIDMYSITSHNPWALPSFYNAPDLSGLYTRFNKKYIDALKFSDEMLGKFISKLRAKDLMKNTIVIIQGDHGYGRMEHGNNPSIADSGLYEEANHVPFLILADDFIQEADKGLVIDQLTMQSDLMATIADILGVTPEEPLYQHGFGHSMRRKTTLSREKKEKSRNEPKKRNHKPGIPLRIDEDEIFPSLEKLDRSSRRIVLCNPFDGMTRGIRADDLKYIFFADDSYKVFNVVDDPHEKSPIATGFHKDQMDSITREMFEYATEQLELNQYLFHAKKFMPSTFDPWQQSLNITMSSPL